ncbi:hypothetical protein DV737_g560, partial [Chaetothyriales sp. CBS 132003]
MVRGADDDHSIASEHTASTTPRRLDAKEVFEAERARRRVEAESLGQGSGSGMTSFAEHQLFIHLSMRGYDPLIPNNWMLDFRTLPLALFADGIQDEPLIHAMHGSEFRATKALRDLFDTGKNLRDKIVFCPDSHFELVLRKAVDKYMHWSLKDAQLPIDHPSWLPVHRIVMRKPNQKTADIVNELETSLQALAQRHRDERSGDDDPTASSKNSMREQEREEDLSMRYVAKFDFSDPTMDVWNAFSVAIVCMIVRKVLLEQAGRK